jgi:hypothetical protein
MRRLKGERFNPFCTWVKDSSNVWELLADYDSREDGGCARARCIESSRSCSRSKPGDIATMGLAEDMFELAVSPANWALSCGALHP